MSYYIVMTRQASMPATCWGRYGNVAVVEVETPDTQPKMLSIRAKGVIRIVQQWGPCSIGKTARSACMRAKAEAEALCTKLNTE